MIIQSEPSNSTRFALREPAIRMAPSLLSADFSRLGEATAAIEAGGAEVLHLDVMDGHFVPNISFGVPVIKSLRSRTKLFFDAHLMIMDPKRYAEPFVKAGCDHITFHIEVAKDPRDVAQHIRSLGVSVGICMNPTTTVGAIEEVIDVVDMVLVMSVWPGFGGQTFMPEVLAKVKQLRARLAPHQRLEIDGGIEVNTIQLAAAAGADTFVAGTAIFGQEDPVAAMHNLHRIANENRPPAPHPETAS